MSEPISKELRQQAIDAGWQAVRQQWPNWSASKELYTDWVEVLLDDGTRPVWGEDGRMNLAAIRAPSSMTLEEQITWGIACKKFLREIGFNTEVAHWGQQPKGPKTFGFAPGNLEASGVSA